MTEQPHIATKDINIWLQRAGLTLDSLQKMSPTQQAIVGRSWQQYQADVKKHQQLWSCSDEEILRAEVDSYHSVPRPDGSRKPKVDLDCLNRRRY